MDEKSAKRLKSIGKGSLITILVFIGFVLCIELLYTLGFKQNTISSRKEAAFAHRRDAVRLLFLGQSDIIRGLNPMEFDTDAYNYAFQGETFIGTYYRLCSCIDQMPKLETVILPVSYTSFSSKRQLSPLSFNLIPPRDLVELIKVRGILILLIEAKKNFAAFRKTTVIEMGKKLVTFLFQGEIQNQVEMVHGFVIGNESRLKRDNAGRRVKILLGGADPMAPDRILYFKKILELCREKKIRVVTVSMPMFDDFIKFANQHITMAQIETAVISKFKNQHLIQAHFDYSTLLSGRHDLFFDQNHLNLDGAIIVSRKLAGDLKQLCLFKK